jgi:hypothetical protein
MVIVFVFTTILILLTADCCPGWEHRVGAGA